jgi:transposase
MKYVGVDLHKQSITVCVVTIVRRTRRVVLRRRFRCEDVAEIRKFFSGLKRFQVVVEATASYEWFVELVQPLAERVLLAHPKKLRIIAESKRKTDKIDAHVLAEFLAMDMIPLAYRPTPRVRDHRVLVRQRQYLQRRITGVKNKLRHILAKYNADIPGLFTEKGRQHLKQFQLRSADRFVADLLVAELAQHEQQLKAADKELGRFAAEAPVAEREARELLDTMPCVGPVTVDVVLSELGDFRRFRSLADVSSYAGLAPGIRESDNKTKQLGITKAGSRWLRWAMIQLAWRMVVKTRRWGFIYLKLKHRCSSKKAIVAVGRRLLGVMFAMLRDGRGYNMVSEMLAHPKT